jgi:hypothetical protein
METVAKVEDPGLLHIADELEHHMWMCFARSSTIMIRKKVA